LQYFFIQVVDLVYHHRTKCGGYHITQQSVFMQGLEQSMGGHRVLVLIKMLQ